MKFINKIISLTAAGAIGFGAQNIAAEEFKILVHNTTLVREDPNQYMQQQSSGVRIYTLEVAKEILRSTNQEFSTRDVPLQRGLFELSRGNNIVLLPLRKTYGRSSKANWIGPVYREQDFLFSRAAYIKNKTVGKTVLPTSACIIRGAAFESSLAAYGIENIFKANSYSNCISMLALGRVDYAAMPESEFFALHLNNENSEIIKHTMIGESDLYIAVSRDVSLQDISAFRIAFATMQKDGRIAKLQTEFIEQSRRNLSEQ